MSSFEKRKNCLITVPRLQFSTGSSSLRLARLFLCEAIHGNSPLGHFHLGDTKFVPGKMFA